MMLPWTVVGVLISVLHLFSFSDSVVNAVVSFRPRRVTSHFFFITHFSLRFGSLREISLCTHFFQYCSCIQLFVPRRKVLLFLITYLFSALVQCWNLGVFCTALIQVISDA